MHILEILVAAGTIIASVLAGVWFIIQKAMGLGVYRQRFDTIEEKTKNADCGANRTKIDDLTSKVKEIRADRKRLAALEYKTRNADCENNRSQIKELAADMKEVKDDISDIKKDIALIKSILAQKFPKSIDIYSMKKSPRKLNPLGEKVFAEIEGPQFLSTNKDFFFEKIDAAAPQTALDVESSAAMACSTSTDNDIFNPIKTYVYNRASIPLEDGTTHDVSLGDVCFILSLPLRDMYLSEHPEITE